MLMRRLIELVAMLAIGDNVLAMISPRRHLSLWRSGPRWWERMMEPFIKRPNLMRFLGLVGLIASIWLAWQQEPPAPAPMRRPSHDGRPWSKRLLEAMQ